MSTNATLEDLLRDVKPVEPRLRFLQHWESAGKVLWLGCGDGNKCYQVGSNQEIRSFGGTCLESRLRTDTVREFVDGAQADSPIREIRQVIEDYIDLRDSRVAALLSVWIVGTYLYSIFDYCGYVFLHSPTPRCGKTTVLQLTDRLAFQPEGPFSGATPPAIRDFAARGGTVLLDTIERWRANRESFAAAMQLLDAGFYKGGTVAKMGQQGDGPLVPEQFDVFAPYMFAAIRAESLSDTACDRSFVIEMRRKDSRVRKLRFEREACERRCRPIREQAYRWALSRAGDVAGVYESPDLEHHVDGLALSDRAVDIWRPILAIALAAGDVDLFRQLSTLAVDMSADPDRAEERRQLAIVGGLRLVAGACGSIKSTTPQLSEQLAEATDARCPDLHRLLSGWGFRQRSTRLEGLDTPRDAWHISDDELAEVERQLTESALPPQMGTTETTPADARPEPELVGVGNEREG